MSWTCNLTPTVREELDAAVDAAEPSGQDAPGVAEAVAAAKTAAKELAKQIKRPIVTVTLSGHALQPDEGSNWSDSIAVSVYGIEAPAVPTE